jgi:hypothetical protein
MRRGYPLTMASNCIGCGKSTGGVFGAYSVNLLYGEVCLTCNKKLKVIPGHQFLTPDQIVGVISGSLNPGDVSALGVAQPGGQNDYSQAPQREPTAADEIRKYKELLDEGIITQSEFDAVKKRLLGL